MSKSKAKAKAKTTTKNFGDYLRNRVNRDLELKDMVDEESIYVQIATQIHDLRKSKGLTQAELADRVGTTQSVIARMENSDYTGHSIPMLTKIARACGAKFRAEFYICEIESVNTVETTTAAQPEFTIEIVNG